MKIKKAKGIDPAKLKAAREKCGYTQRQLAAISGMSQTYLARLELGGQPDIRISSAWLIAKALRVKIESLVLYAEGEGEG